jgi:hypothetical protein
MGSSYAVSLVRGIASRIKTYHSNPAMDRSVKIVRHLEQVFEPYRMMFMELEGGGGRKEAAPHHNISEKKRKNTKIVKNCFELSIIRGFSLFAEGL